MKHLATMMTQDTVPALMSKDLATWQMSCILEELYHINDRVLQGDYSERAGLKKAQAMLGDHKASLSSLPGMIEAWVDCSVAYGGFIQVSWRFVWNDGETQRGNCIPVRK